MKPLEINKLRIVCNLAIYTLVYNYFMPACSIVKTITPRCRGRPDALLHEAEGRGGKATENWMVIFLDNMGALKRTVWCKY